MSAATSGLGNIVTTNPVTSIKGQGKSSLTMNDFLSLLSTELSNQLPTDPMSSRDYYAQLAQLGTVQGIDKLNVNSTLSQLSSILGKNVSATRPGGGGSNVVGTATSISLQNGSYTIGVKESNGNITNVQIGDIQNVS